MFWIKLFILLVGFTFAGLLPYTVKKTIRHTKINLKTQTLSFLSNKSLYGKKHVKEYTRLLFSSAILLYIFFWLLSKFYDLGGYEKLMRDTDICFASLALLAFVPHNINPYSLENLKPTLQRIMHNLLAVVVFLSIPGLIITYQLLILTKIPFLGLTGLIIIGIVVLLTIFLFIKTGVNGSTELFFINGIAVWSIFVTVVTVLTQSK